MAFVPLNLPGLANGVCMLEEIRRSFQMKIDIHSHILFGLDDGAADLEDSLALAKIYLAAGYQQVVATPHAHVDSLPTKNYGATIRRLVSHLNNCMVLRDLPLEVFPGMEVGLDPSLPELVARGEILTLADSPYLLVETPFLRLPLNWREILFSLSSNGTTVILAHPERCAQVAEKPELLDQMAQAGAKFQLTWDSFSGAYGRRAAQLARFMARSGFIHCLATDTHDADRRNAGSVGAIWSDLTLMVGEANLKSIAIENPARVVQGAFLMDMDLNVMPKPAGIKKRGGLRRLMARFNFN